MYDIFEVGSLPYITKSKLIPTGVPYHLKFVMTDVLPLAFPSWRGTS